jgi:hypothetical protein
MVIIITFHCPHLLREGAFKMLFSHEGWHIEVDIEKTRKAYQLLRMQNQFGLSCTCQWCQNINHHLYQKQFPSFIINTCSQLGIDYHVPGEFYVIDEKDTDILCHGFYSFYGVINSKPEKKILGDIFFEKNSPFGTLNFPVDDMTLLLGLSCSFKKNI